MSTDATLAELNVIRHFVRDDDPTEALALLAVARGALTGPTTLDAVCAACDLSAFERAVLLLACGPELVGAVAGELEKRDGVPYLTFGSALSLLPDAHWSACSPASGLRRWRLLTPEDPSRPVSSRLRVDEHILHLVVGLDEPDARVIALSRPVPNPQSPEAGAADVGASRAGRPADPQAGSAHVDDLAARWADGPVWLDAVRPEAARDVAAVAAERANRTLRELTASDLPTDPDALREVALLSAREALLGRTAWWLDLTGCEQSVAARAARAFADCPYLATRTAPTGAIWVRPAASWERLVLPEADLEHLRALAASVRHREQVLDRWGFGELRQLGRGTSALFAGPSGTGKTFAAEVVAAELGRDLLLIDLSQVVSKYIGETEKQLAVLFDAAERSGAVLLFDEADALFGKRTEVRDSHDRYANIEVSYLLQRLERFCGLAILTTNARGAIDQAFLRRLTTIVTFGYPDAAARLSLWERAFPDAMPRGDLDLAALARVDATGATIISAALAGAYLAADADEPVSTTHVLRALERELAKTGRMTITGGR